MPRYRNIPHRLDIETFAKLIAGDEVLFVSCPYSALLASWPDAPDPAEPMPLPSRHGSVWRRGTRTRKRGDRGIRTMGRIDRGGEDDGDHVQSPPGLPRSGRPNSIGLAAEPGFPTGLDTPAINCTRPLTNGQPMSFRTGNGPVPVETRAAIAFIAARACGVDDATSRASQPLGGLPLSSIDLKTA